MSIDWNLILRLVIAGLMGGIIGLERESRAKEAGIRTHFIVALGSALFMIISQYAFNGRFDAARVAAQVVSGIGFLGAGVIIFQKNVIRGVTTAAGLWVVAAIGLAGMYVVAGTATVLTAICLEMMHFFHLHYGEKLVDIKLDTHGNKDLATVMDALEKAKISVESYSVFEGKVHLSLRMPTRHYAEQLHTLFELLEGFNIEELS